MKSVLNVHWKDWFWSWSSNTLATWCEELTHLKRPWCWERLKVREEGDDREWDGWMASPTQWTWVWVNFVTLWWREAWHVAAHGVAKTQAPLSYWTELSLILVFFFFPNWKIHYSTSSFLLWFQTLVNTLSGWPYHRNFLASCLEDQLQVK